MNNQKYRYKINLVTLNDIKEFLSIAEKIPAEVKIYDSSECNFGNAKTLFNVCESIYWDDVWISSDYDMYTEFKKFII